MIQYFMLLKVNRQSIPPLRDRKTVYSKIVSNLIDHPMQKPEDQSSIHREHTPKYAHPPCFPPQYLAEDHHQCRCSQGKGLRVEGHQRHLNIHQFTFVTAEMMVLQMIKLLKRPKLSRTNPLY